MLDLLKVAKSRKNIIPIMAGVSLPEQYGSLVESVDIIYQDVAQPNQVSIAIKNSAFLKKSEKFILVLKVVVLIFAKNLNLYLARPFPNVFRED